MNLHPMCVFRQIISFDTSIIKYVIIVLSFTLFFKLISFSQQVIYVAPFGNTETALGTLVPNWTSSGVNNLQISTGSASNNYTSPIQASGGANLCDCGNLIGNTVATLSEAVNTISFGNIRVLFGYRQTVAYSGIVSLEWSADGILWNSIVFNSVNNSSWALAGSSWFSLPASANNQPNLRFRFNFARNSTGQENFRIDDFTVTGTSLIGTTLPNHYFRSLKSGNWEYATTWESSLDSLHWINASLVPGSDAAGIAIQASHTISINDHSFGKFVRISAGATLHLSNNVNFVLTDALSNRADMIIEGALILSGNRPSEITNARYVVENGGAVKVLNNNSIQQSDDFVHSNPFIIFKTGSVFEWSASTPFESAGKTYFQTSSKEYPIFRISNNVLMGASSPNHTTINGFVEVVTGKTLYIQNSGIRYFRDGFGGAGNIQISAGTIEITGTNLLNTRIQGTGSTLLSGTTNGIFVSTEAKVSLSTNYSIQGIGFNFTVGSGGSLYCGESVLYGSANFILASGGLLGIGSIDGICNGATGNIQTAGRSFQQGSHYLYNGKTDQFTGDALPTTITGGVILRNTGIAGNNKVVLSKSIIISGYMEFDKGIFITNNTDKILRFDSGSVARTFNTSKNQYIPGGNINSYVEGYVQKNGNEHFIFPLGSSPKSFTIPTNPPVTGFSGGYRPLGIDNLSGSEIFTAGYVLANPTIWKIRKEAYDYGLKNINTCEYWHLTRAGKERADISLSWSTNQTGQSQCNIINSVNPSYLQVVPFYNGEWGDQANTYFGNSNVHTDTAIGISYINWDGDRPNYDINSFEKFVLGSINIKESPLHLNSENHIQFPDKQKILMNDQKQIIRMMPVPAKNHLWVYLSKPEDIDRITIQTITGQRMYQLLSPAGTHPIDISGLIPGLYFLQITGKIGTVTKSFIKQ